MLRPITTEHARKLIVSSMNGNLDEATRQRLAALHRRIRRQGLQAAVGYSLALAGVLALYLFFPFTLCRVGSVVLMIALAQMLSKLYQANRASAGPGGGGAADRLLKELSRVEAQLRLRQSAIYNLPYLVGVNLFFMGLPGTGSIEVKAWLDCFFLAGTVLVFSGCYLANQLTLRREFLPLLGELRAVISSQ